MSDTPVAITDRSQWGLIRFTGSTRQAFLHNQSTNDFNHLRPGFAQDTVWLTSTARVIDLTTVLADADAHWMLTSPERHDVLLNWMPRFVFFMDDVKFVNEAGNYAIYSLFGAGSDDLLAALGGTPLPVGSHALQSIAGVADVRVLAESGLTDTGYTLIVPAADAPAVWSALTASGARLLSAAEWEDERIRQGRPAADKELIEEYNPLEVGLWEAVSFTKGCYIGQEIVARLDTYQKLKQQLWGLELSAPAAPGDAIVLDGQEVGTVTSVTSDSTRGLGFVRVKAGGEGLKVIINGVPAVVVQIAYVTRGRKELAS